MAGVTAARHFSNCKEFYDSTREDNITDLCNELGLELNKGTAAKDGEWNSWYFSLPDFAELLYDPASYRQKTLNEAYSLDKDLEDEITLLEKLSGSDELRALIDSQVFSQIMSSAGTEAIKKALDHNTAMVLGALEKSLSVLKGSPEDSLGSIIKGLKNQKDVLLIARTKLEGEPLPPPIEDVEVDLEYPVFSEDSGKPKRIDVLLSRPDRGKYAIIELKQWTEDNIDIITAEDDEGNVEYLVSIVPGKRSQPHPAIKVRDVYKKALDSKLRKECGQEAEIEGFVYLHNQMYGDGQLFKFFREMDIGIYDKDIGSKNILYTKLWHGRLLKRLADLFGTE